MSQTYHKSTAADAFKLQLHVVLSHKSPGAGQVRELRSFGVSGCLFGSPEWVKEWRSVCIYMRVCMWTRGGLSVQKEMGVKGIGDWTFLDRA